MSFQIVPQNLWNGDGKIWILEKEPNVIGKTQPVSFMWNRFWLVYPLRFEPFSIHQGQGSAENRFSI